MVKLFLIFALLNIGFCIFSGSLFGQNVPFRRMEIDHDFTGDGKAIGDIDGDGLSDIIIGGAKLVWYRAPGWTKIIIASGQDFGTEIDVGDIDNDGDLDVIAPDQLEEDNVMWFENPLPRGDPSEASWSQHLIGTFKGAPISHPHDIALGDIDDNGKLDLVTRRGNTTVWLQADPNTWTQVDLVNATREYEGTALADLDKDGDLDVVLNGYWMEAPAQKNDGSAWLPHIIDPDWPIDARVTIGDIDKDGNADVILSRSESEGGRLSWYKAVNPKIGPWMENIISDDLDYVHTLKVTDIDQDGQLDVIFAEMAHSKQKRVGFFRNGGNGLDWKLQVLDTTGSHNARIGDIGGDRDIDIVGANWQGPPVHLWENLSSKPYRIASARIHLPKMSAAPDDTILVPIIVSSDSAFGFAQFVVDYDSTILTFLDATVGDAVSNFTIFTDPNLPFEPINSACNKNVLIQVYSLTNSFTGETQEIAALIMKVAGMSGQTSPLAFDPIVEHTFLTTVRGTNLNGDGLQFNNGCFLVSTLTEVMCDNSTLSAEFSLSQNYPNPFNSTTVIRFSLPQQSLVTLKVFDLFGREVARLLNKKLPPGEYNVLLRAEHLPSGMYFYRLQADGFVANKKLILLK